MVAPAISHAYSILFQSQKNKNIDVLLPDALKSALLRSMLDRSFQPTSAFTMRSFEVAERDLCSSSRVCSLSAFSAAPKLDVRKLFVRGAAILQPLIILSDGRNVIVHSGKDIIDFFSEGATSCFQLQSKVAVFYLSRWIGSRSHASPPRCNSHTSSWIFIVHWR